MAVPTCLELGCGTGFFLLNHKLAGIVDDGFVTYLSAGMVLAADENARRLDFEVRGRVADAEGRREPGPIGLGVGEFRVQVVVGTVRGGRVTAFAHSLRPASTTSS